MSATRFFFFNDTATTEIYTLSLHDALPISEQLGPHVEHGADEQAAGAAALDDEPVGGGVAAGDQVLGARDEVGRSEEHTSELQSQSNLVCRLLLAKNTMQW